jgi:pimeloyl-ACP methyl ester carboxylesterase
MATIVLAHGAWSAAWAWKKMRPLFGAAGHEFFSPTYTGLGERAHLADPDIDLSTHVQDVTAVLEFEDLQDVTLLGHSYGGMVATGVADRVPGRLARVVYIDAFAPQDGQSLFDLVGPKAEANMRAGALKDGEGWKLPINPMPTDTAGGPCLGEPAAPSAADQDFRAEAPPGVQAATAAAPLHLRQAQRAGRRVPPVRRPRQERGGLEILRDRCQS